ncbi:9286_t:CDS:2 [Acaulospora colombiana]|uniref:9286_t:CDS:1 n=1 Tax=Acaulospora colombiana TaxID=27376 RepID=A0ACA9K8L3_9GLOM|nr:9286_t:CDS:2 [Acaulospora colombiana]
MSQNYKIISAYAAVFTVGAFVGAGTAQANRLNSENETRGQIITPWTVEGAVVDGKSQAIDYDKLIEQFGTKHIDEELLKRFEALTGKKCHILLRRGIFFSHRQPQFHRMSPYNIAELFLIIILIR